MSKWLRFLPVLLLVLVVGALVWRLANPPDTTICTCANPSASSALRTLRTSCGFTPRGSNPPICDRIDRSTSVSDVSSRTPYSRSPSARAHASDVPTQSLSKSTRPMTLTDSGIWRAKAWVAATVSPPNAAIRAWGTVPIPSEPHHEAWASVDTPMAPATCAAQPSPVCTIQ